MRSRRVRQPIAVGRFPIHSLRASTPWHGAKEVSGVALVVAQEVPTSSTMSVPHGPAGVGEARHRMRGELRSSGVPESVIDDAVLILSELLSNACRYGRPLDADDGAASECDTADGGAAGAMRAAWRVEACGRLTVEATDGGGPTRPLPATPSITARGGRGLHIITALAEEWGVRDGHGEVTVWAVLSPHDAPPEAPSRIVLTPELRYAAPCPEPLGGRGGALDGLEELNELGELDGTA
ncbi:ATP-binding protein [Streptomyces buecherae]|uniref:ATP-binding protein n=1 Tax=Streptomyces buecherae TaxID=2763006 RepID=UPI001C251FDF